MKRLVLFILKKSRHNGLVMKDFYQQIIKCELTFEEIGT